MSVSAHRSRPESAGGDHVDVLRRLLPFLGILAAYGVTFAIYDSHLALSATWFLSVALGCWIVGRATPLGSLSWEAGIPFFYLVFFYVIPIVTRAIGQGFATRESYFSTDDEVSAALFAASFGLVAFIVGVVLARATTISR